MLKVYIQDLEKILLHEILKASREQDSQEQMSFPLLFQIQKLQYSVNTGGSTMTDTQTGHGSAAFKKLSTVFKNSNYFSCRLSILGLL